MPSCAVSCRAVLCYVMLCFWARLHRIVLRVACCALHCVDSSLWCVSCRVVSCCLVLCSALM